LASVFEETDEKIVIALPEVKSLTLEKVIQYCEFHSKSSLTEKDKKNWDADFVQIKQTTLCEIASASYNLDIKPLVLLTSRAIATQISGKSSEEIRETFSHFNYDSSGLVGDNSYSKQNYCSFTICNCSILATRYRLQRKISYSRQQDKTAKNEPAAVQEEDHRSLDELLSFINETDSSESPNKKGKMKKKKKGRTHKTLPSDSDPSMVEEDQSDEFTSSQIIIEEENDEQEQEDEGEDIEEESFGREQQRDDEIPETIPFPEEEEEEEEEDAEQDLDPERIAAIDKEVEEFRQRLEAMNQQSNTVPKISLPFRIESSNFLSCAF